MNFSLPGIFIFIRLDTAHNLADPVGSATITLGLSPHQTDGQIRVLTAELKLVLVLLAVLLDTLLIPPSLLDAVAVLKLPVVRASGVAIAETGEVPRVGVGHGQPEP